MFNKIIIINLLLLFYGFFLYKKHNNIKYIFLNHYIFIINEILNYYIGFDIYDGHIRTELAYSTNGIYNFLSKDLQNMSLNFTEGIFNDNECISPTEAEENRFYEFMRLCKLNKGDSVLDAGCGHGGLVKFLRERGIDAYGITISKQQYVDNKKNIGDYFFCGDYTKKHTYLLDKFDVIILPGSLEHPFGGRASLESSYINKYNKMKEMFSLFKLYFKKDSHLKLILTTCIHMNLKFKDSIQAFFIERSLGGLYPSLDKYSVANAKKAVGYNIISEKDYTWHYYYTSVCDSNHFGNPMDFGLLQTFVIFLLYPHIIYIYLYLKNGYWLWQWSNKDHIKTNLNYYFEKDSKKRPCTLLYTLAQLP